MSAIFRRLRNGSWGIEGPADEVYAGNTVEVVKRNGESTLVKVIWCETIGSLDGEARRVATFVEVGPDTRPSIPVAPVKLEAVKPAPRNKLINWNGQRITFAFPYNKQIIAEIKSITGRTFSHDTKIWSLPEERVAAACAIGRKFKFEASAQFITRFGDFSEDGVQERIWDHDRPVPVPDGKDLFPFQRAGVDFLIGTKGALLADEMGVGKTIQAIGLINTDESIKRAIVISPAGLKLNWARELDSWLTRDLTVGIVRDGKNWSDTDIVIISYEAVRKHREVIDAISWDLVVCDEAHYLKSPKAQRTVSVVGSKGRGAIRADRRVLMTGTPILNRPIDLYPLLNYLQPTAWGSYWDYAKRYAGAYRTEWGMDVQGASNLGELRRSLQSVMLRREKRDVLSELPAKMRQVIVIEATREMKKAVAEEQRLISEGQKAIAQAKAEVGRLKQSMSASEEYRAAIRRLSSLQASTIGEMARARHVTALAKVPAVIDHVRDVLDNESKVVIMAHHHDVIEGLCAGLAEFGVVRLTGEDSLKSREAVVRSFQNDPSTRAFVGSTQAAGVGITLTAANTVVFAELDWVPANLTQAEDRVHRIGQDAESVLIQHIVVDGSIDVTMAQKIISKQEVIDKVVGSKIDDPAVDNDAFDLDVAA